MDGEDLKLVRATRELKDEFLDMAREWLEAGDERYAKGIDDFEAYMVQADRYHDGTDIFPPFVPSSEYWLMKESRIVGRVSIRHRLNENLLLEGGHIGYDIRPSERCRGYGSAQLTLALIKTREMGIDRVFITCDTDNLASAKIIEKNGGKLAGNAISKLSGKQINQYWIGMSRR